MSNIIYIVLAGICWGIAPLFTAGLLERNISAVEIASMRAFGASVVLFLIAAYTRRDIFHAPLRRIVRLMLTGALSFGVMCLTYPICIDVLGVSMAVVFLYTAPIYVTLFFAITGTERLTLQRVISLILILVGAALTSGLLEYHKFQYTPMGICIGITCGLSYALVTIFRKTLQADADSFEVVAYTTLGGSIALMFAAPIHTIPLAGNMPSFLINSIIGTVIPFLFYQNGLARGVKPTVASSIASTELLVAALCGFIILHEPVSAGKVLGILAVFLGGVIAVK